MTRLEAVQPVLMVRDVRRAITFYRRLGFQLSFTDSDADPTYAGIRRDGIELHLQGHDAAEWQYPNDRPTYRFPVDDVDSLHAEFVAAGVGVGDGAGEIKEPAATPWGTYEFHVRDPDVNGLQFYRDLETP